MAIATNGTPDKVKSDSISWLPLMGDFEEREDGLLFKGRYVDSQQGDKVDKLPLIGKCVSDRTFNGGHVSAEITFSEVANSLAEIVVFNDVTTGDMLTAGLGGDFFLFAVRFWSQSLNRWMPQLAKGGSRQNLQPNRAYQVEVALRGSSIHLKVDNIDVANVYLPFQPAGSQVGIFCVSPVDIKISRFTVRPQVPTAFVVMPFTPRYDELYKDVIRPVCRKHGLQPHRADETSGPGVIIADIERQIADAKIVVAEITPNPVNPNVYYEVGYSHATRKPTILIADRRGTDKLPFDVSPFRVLFYEDSIGGERRIEEELSKHLLSIMPEGKPLTNGDDGDG